MEAQEFGKKRHRNLVMVFIEYKDQTKLIIFFRLGSEKSITRLFILKISNICFHQKCVSEVFPTS